MPEDFQAGAISRLPGLESQLFTVSGGVRWASHQAYPLEPNQSVGTNYIPVRELVGISLQLVSESAYSRLFVFSLLNIL